MSKNTLALAPKYYLHTFELTSLGPRALLLFHKIHCGAVSIEKDKYTTHGCSQFENYQVITRFTVMPWRILPPTKLFHIGIADLSPSISVSVLFTGMTLNKCAIPQ